MLEITILPVEKRLGKDSGLYWMFEYSHGMAFFVNSTVLPTRLPQEYSEFGMLRSVSHDA